MGLTTGQKKAIFIGSLLTGVAAIGLYVSRQYYLLTNAAQRLVGAKVHNLSLNKVDITVDVEIDNKGDLSANVTNQDYNIYINGIYVSNIASKDDIHLNSKGKTVLPLRINFNPQEVASAALQNLTAIVGDKSKLLISVRGKFTAKIGILTLANFPFSFDTTLSEILLAENKPK